MNSSSFGREADYEEGECQRERLDNESTVIPAAFSWQDQGKVSPVYFQYTCLSCYVFSTTSALESQYMMKYNYYKQFSVQETLNCMSGGCHGGLFPEPMNFMVNYGVTEEAYAPYQNQVTMNQPIRAIRPLLMCLSDKLPGAAVYTPWTSAIPLPPQFIDNHAVASHVHFLLCFSFSTFTSSFPPLLSRTPPTDIAK